MIDLEELSTYIMNNFPRILIEYIYEIHSKRFFCKMFINSLLHSQCNLFEIGISNDITDFLEYLPQSLMIDEVHTLIEEMGEI